MNNVTPNTVVFKRQGSGIIYPWTEANSKNPNLVQITIEEAQQMGLFNIVKKDNPEVTKLKTGNDDLLAENALLKQQLEDMKHSQQSAKEVKPVAAIKTKPVLKTKASVQKIKPKPKEQSDDITKVLSELGINE